MSQDINEVELGKFLGSVDVIPDAFGAISETSSTYKLHTTPSGIQVLAFSCPSDYTTRFLKNEFGLVSSKDHENVDFISDGEVKSSFSINKAAVELFECLPNYVQLLKNKIIHGPLVVTGRGLGGYVAILFALWLHQAVDVEESNDYWSSKRPVCITFGCPLVGGEDLQGIISKSPQWESRFLNVVAKEDRFASFFSSSSEYKPFGTFLFCTESGERTALQDPDLILAVLDRMGSPRAENMEIHDYGKSVSEIRRKTLYRRVSELGEFNKQEYFKDLIERMKEKTTGVYDPTKKLNDMKIRMTQIEGWMNKMRSHGGIYDFYRVEPKTREDIDIQNNITEHRRALTMYWEWFFEDTKRKPQKEDAKMRKRWLLNAHNYRRMIEPLNIAEYYRKGNRNYIAKRSNHYLKLEELLSKKGFSPSNGNNRATSLTNDSCFWARVEEALISLTNLKKEDLDHTLADTEQKILDDFEANVMDEINGYSMSPDIFLKGSSFMKWWYEYKAYKGSAYESDLAQFMNAGTYSSFQFK